MLLHFLQFTRPCSLVAQINPDKQGKATLRVISKFWWLGKLYSWHWSFLLKYTVHMLVLVAQIDSDKEGKATAHPILQRSKFIFLCSLFLAP